HINHTAAVTGNQARAWQLTSVAEMAANARSAGDLDTTEHYCLLAEATLRLWSKEEFQNLQSRIPVNMLPDKTAELFAALTAYKNFQATPLAAHLSDIDAESLDNATYDMQEKLAEHWAGPVPGADWTFPDLPDLNFKYIPSGGLPGEPTESFWIADCEVTGRLLRKVLPENARNTADDDLPASQLCWNDRMDFCRKLTEKARKMGLLPQNCIIRLPYLSEWNFVMHGAWTSAGSFLYENMNVNDFAWFGGNSMYQIHAVKQKTGGTLGIYDLVGNVAESVLQRATLPGGTPRIFNCGASFRDRRVSSQMSRKCDTDMLENKWSGFRVVIAPGNMDYFENNWYTGEKHIIVNNPDTYELIGSPHCRWQAASARQWHKLLNSKPVILQESALRKKLFRSSPRLQELPVITNAFYANSQWQWQDKTPVTGGEWLNDFNNEHFKAMVWDHGFWRGITGNDTAPLIMIKYNAEKTPEVNLSNAASELILERFTFKGKKYFLLSAPVDWYTAKRLAELAGGQLATPANSAELAFMTTKLKKYKKLKIALGGFRKLGKWYWINGAAGPARLKAMNKTDKISLNNAFTAIYNGKLRYTQTFDAFLCEVK
ncbi:MAG: SUMF1/EgtB/PvdO family nonheme iron enzyme, partial [Lentisphaeria bacterium]|nr:SUMF1/EgtB/PvdO family nonheme iron enzyme [Lentisphaeria bacterium]